MKGIHRLPAEAVYDEMNSPVGTLTILSSGKGLHAILWESDFKNLKYTDILTTLNRSPNDKTIVEIKKQLAEYFQGKRQVFDLVLAPSGTEFQMQAWQQLLQIPYAKTVTYAEQAAKIGNKNKARAVGLANGQNPISIVIPCHRVIGSNGNLVGFGGGLATKAYLLNLEQKWRNHEP